MPDTVQAALRVQRPSGQVDDWFHVVLEYPTRQVMLTSSMLAADQGPRFMVRGTTASLVKRGTDNQERRLMAGDRPGGPDWGDDPDPLHVLRDGAEVVRVPVPPGNYGRYYALMRDAIQRGMPVPVPAAEAMAVMSIIIAGIESSDAGRAVRPADLLG
jgi:predicted dehydrogenase